MQRVNIFLLVLCVSLLILVAGLFHALKQHFPYAPQINAEQKADGTFKGDKKSEGNAPTAHQIDRGENPQEAEKEGTEFWPPFLGIRLKITDSLLWGCSSSLPCFGDLPTTYGRPENVSSNLLKPSSSLLIGQELSSDLSKDRSIPVWSLRLYGSPWSIAEKPKQQSWLWDTIWLGEKGGTGGCPRAWTQGRKASVQLPSKAESG
jgi:hypothetical protein